MNKGKIIYWATTAVVAVAMLFSAYTYFTAENIKASFGHLGFPDYFRIQLGVAKALGAIVLILPVAPPRLKEFAYAGFSIAFISAIIAHTASNDPVSVILKALALLILLIVSYVYFYRIRYRGGTKI